MWGGTRHPTYFELPFLPTQIGWGGQTGTASSAVWSRFLTLRHTKNMYSQILRISVLPCMGDRLLTQEMSKFPFEPPSQCVIS